MLPYEVCKKFKLHFDNVKPFADKLGALGFELISTKNEKTIYVTKANPYIKIRSTKQQVGDGTKVKSEYIVVKTKMEKYESKKDGKPIIREIPYITEETVSRFVANAVLGVCSKDCPPVLVKLRRRFQKKTKPEGITSDKTHFVIVDFDEVQNLGPDNVLFVEFKMMVENISDKKEAIQNINEVIGQLQPFIGDFPGEPYLNYIKVESKTL